MVLQTLALPLGDVAIQQRSELYSPTAIHSTIKAGRDEARAITAGVVTSPAVQLKMAMPTGTHSHKQLCSMLVTNDYAAGGGTVIYNCASCD